MHGYRVQPAILHDHCFLSLGGDPRIVGNYHKSAAGLAVIRIQPFQQRHDGGAIGRIEFARGFIREDDGRFQHQGAGDGDPLLLAA